MARRTNDLLFEHFGNTELRRRGSLSIDEGRGYVATRQIPAAFDQSGRLIRHTMRLQADGHDPPDSVPRKLPAKQDIVVSHEQDVVWGGSITGHYGHFLTESTARLWPMLPGGVLEGAPVALAMEERYPFAAEWLNALGLQRLDLPEDGFARFARLHIPEPAWRLNAWISPEIRDVHLCARRGLEVTSEKLEARVLWLSRSQLARNRRPYDEALLEWILMDHVVTVSPETMTLPEQIGLLEGAKTVVGAVGSAFHTTLMCFDPPKAIYLCPMRFQSAHVAQSWVLKTEALFVHALAGVKMKSERDVRFPGEHRLMIPEILRTLGSTALCGLLEDPRFLLFAYPERLWASATSGHLDGSAADIDVAIAKVLLDPLNLWERMMLGVAFEREGLNGCALEQYLMVATLASDYAKAPLSASRCLSREGRDHAASEMAKRALALEPSCKEAIKYI